MEINLNFIIFVVATFIAVHLVEAQDQTGFISLDCGRPLKDAPYTENITELTYISDSNLINTGESRSIKPEYRKDWQEPLWFLRSFPEGVRNCYTLRLTAGQKYLIRASFLYGNYDNKDELPSFDLYIGRDLWASVTLKDVDKWIYYELLQVSASNLLRVCLVKSGDTVPFISLLELRPLSDQIYNSNEGSLLTYRRWYLSNGRFSVGFPQDIHDRYWNSAFDTENWREISTELPVNTNNFYDPPQLVMRSAATPINNSVPFQISWSSRSASSLYYVYLHFAEVEILKPNELREFRIMFNGNTWYGPFSPVNHTITTIYSPTGLQSETGRYDILFQRTVNSTHPPLLNAIEVYSVASF